MATASYDEIADVLYVSLMDPPQPARTKAANVTALLRFNARGDLVGITIEAAKAQARKQR